MLVAVGTTNKCSMFNSKIVKTYLTLILPSIPTAAINMHGGKESFHGQFCSGGGLLQFQYLLLYFALFRLWIFFPTFLCFSGGCGLGGIILGFIFRILVRFDIIIMIVIVISFRSLAFQPFLLPGWRAFFVLTCLGWHLGFVNGELEG